MKVETPQQIWPGSQVRPLGRGRIIAIALVVAAVVLGEGLVLGEKSLLIFLAACALLTLVYLLWQVEPAITMSVGFFLTPFAGNWSYLGIPHGVDPDRLLVTFAIAQVVFRSPAARDRPAFRFRAEHWMMVLALLYACASAFVAHTLFTKSAFFLLYDTFGFLPFVTFLVAPYVFRTTRQREFLLVSMIAMGAYLGFTTLFAAAHVNALVFPKYILNPNIGIHYGRGRGPFLEAVENGFAQAVCAMACAIATVLWPRGSLRRRLAVAVGLLCFVGAFLSLERSVWIASVLGLTVAMASSRQLRRHLITLIVTVAFLIALALVFIPSLHTSVTQRLNEQSTVWDRDNLNEAGLNMLEARPLFGFGWQTFTEKSELYFRRNPNYPLTATNSDISNFVLGYAVDLGLAGVTIWLLVLALGVGRSLMARRGPPEQEAWNIGLVGISVMFVVVAAFVPPELFPNLSLWLWSGVVLGVRGTSIRLPVTRDVSLPASAAHAAVADSAGT